METKTLETLKIRKDSGEGFYEYNSFKDAEARADLESNVLRLDGKTELSSDQRFNALKALEITSLPAGPAGSGIESITMPNASNNFTMTITTKEVKMPDEFGSSATYTEHDFTASFPVIHKLYLGPLPQDGDNVSNYTDGGFSLDQEHPEAAGALVLPEQAMTYDVAAPESEAQNASDDNSYLIAEIYVPNEDPDAAPILTKHVLGCVKGPKGDPGSNGLAGVGFTELQMNPDTHEVTFKCTNDYNKTHTLGILNGIKDVSFQDGQLEIEYYDPTAKSDTFTIRYPTELTIDSDGKIAVTYSTKDNESYQLDFPKTIAIDSDGKIDVTYSTNETANYQLNFPKSLEIDSDGKIDVTYSAQEKESYQLDFPKSFHVSPEGKLTVTSTKNQAAVVGQLNFQKTLSLNEKDGTITATYSADDKDTKVGQLDFPTALELKTDGNLYASYTRTGEKSLGKVVGKSITGARLDSDGNLLVTYKDCEADKGTEENLGNVKGVDGVDGKDGVGLFSVPDTINLLNPATVEVINYPYAGVPNSFWDRNPSITAESLNQAKIKFYISDYIPATKGDVFTIQYLEKQFTVPHGEYNMVFADISCVIWYDNNKLERARTDAESGGFAAKCEWDDVAYVRLQYTDFGTRASDFMCIKAENYGVAIKEPYFIPYRGSNYYLASEYLPSDALTNHAQTMTDDQKTVARINIGAAGLTMVVLTEQADGSITSNKSASEIHALTLGNTVVMAKLISTDNSVSTLYLNKSSTDYASFLDQSSDGLCTIYTIGNT